MRLALVDEVYHRRCPVDAEHGWLDLLHADYVRTKRRPSWSALDEYLTPMPALETLALALPIDERDLATIERLTLDGDRDIYGAYPYWWDLDPGRYTIGDLTGLEHCTKLVYLNLGQGLVDGCSLEPLRGLPALATLWLCARCNHRDLDALLELPALEHLELANVGSCDDRASWERIVSALRARGVRVP